MLVEQIHSGAVLSHLIKMSQFYVLSSIGGAGLTASLTGHSNLNRRICHHRSASVLVKEHGRISFRTAFIDAVFDDDS